MKFTKYHKFGAYHWKQYEDKNTKYSRYADRIKGWIKEKNVLDIGAGDGKITHLLGIRGVDNEPEAVRLAKEKGADVVLGEAYNLPFKDEEFDAAFVGDVLEHLEFPHKGLKEARRVIKNYLYIASPEKGTNKDKFHYQEWTPEELKELVEGEGFALEGEILEVSREKRIYGKFKKTELKDEVLKTPAPKQEKENKYKNINLEVVTSSHFPMLIKAVQMSKGTVVELGSGIFSTPLLHWLCFENKRKLITYENYSHYYDLAKKFESDNHHIRFIKDWDEVEPNEHFSVVLIDHTPKRPRTRGMDLIKFKDHADYIVVHDTGPKIEAKYGYEEAWPYFKYRYDWKKHPYWTTVVSNFKPLNWND